MTSEAALPFCSLAHLQRGASMQSLGSLMGLADKFLYDGWLQVILAAFLLAQLAICIDKAHRALSRSGKRWKETGRAALALVKRAETSLNRMMGYQENRPPRPVIDATMLAGDVLLYWMLSAWLLALGSALVLLVIALRPQDLKLIAISVLGTLGFYVFAAIYRNLGAKSFRSLVSLFKAQTGNPRRQFLMAASIAVFASGLAVFVYLVLPFVHKG
ncbi:hypothetical protein [Pandoraea apista]|uniref:hypothetical protein n=1 Tax=Pandoraea apista TaxID=93218 RepID=UPI0012E0DD02|nr:hypothetical protein [Pandoraea apista]